MRSIAKLAGLFVVVGVFLVAVLAAPDEKPPEMKFNDVKEIAPGVYFRYSSISATDPSVPFGGSNETWIIFKDYVVVVDANFPKEAADVIAAIKKTTDKPIKYVLDTHHHGDHAYGNAVWAKEGAKIIAQRNCDRLLKTNGPKLWEEAAALPKGREDLRTSELKQVDIPFDEKYVLEDDTQRVEFLFLGHAHTPGDAVAYLPKHKILCTGDACVNGAFNFMGHSNSASWIKVVEKMEKLDVKLVCPGHGPLTGREVFVKQKRYFADMRTQIQKGIDDGKKLEDIKLDMAWYKDWTGKDANAIPDNIKHVYSELTGKIDHEKLGRGNDANPWPYGQTGAAQTVPVQAERTSRGSE
jgi:glyoxylase-like metal-dependent hydrolase (beta-lactamase superfamily II)